MCSKVNRAAATTPDRRSEQQSGGLIEGFKLLASYFDADTQDQLAAEVREIMAIAPLFTPAMPRSGKPFSVQMTNAGALGWVSDVEGYRYQAVHPVTGRPWPPIPEILLRLWRDVAEVSCAPEACLVNYYDAGARLGSHKDADEEDMRAPVVSVSLGADGVFHIGGLKRADPKVRMTLRSGDVVVMAGPSRCAYHGIDRIKAGSSSLFADDGRINLTLRRVTKFEAGPNGPR